MSTVVTPYSTSDSLVFKIITFRGYEFAVEPFVGPYVLVSLMGSDMPAKQARNTKPAIKAAIIALYEEMTPEPEPPAPATAILVFPESRVFAVSEPTVTTNRINIETLIAADNGKSRAGRALEALRNLQNEVGDQPWLLAAIDACHALEYNPAGVTKTGKPRKARGKTSPAEAHTREHSIRVPQPPTRYVGEYYPNNFNLSGLITEFASKYGVLPTRIAFNDLDQPYRLDSYSGIPVVRNSSTPRGQIHLSYDPKLGEKVA